MLVFKYFQFKLFTNYIIGDIMAEEHEDTKQYLVTPGFIESNDMIREGVLESD